MSDESALHCEVAECVQAFRCWLLLSHTRSGRARLVSMGRRRIYEQWMIAQSRRRRRRDCVSLPSSLRTHSPARRSVFRVRSTLWRAFRRLRGDPMDSDGIFAVTLDGGRPWGLRLQGGYEYAQRIRIAKVGNRCCYSVAWDDHDRM